MRKVFIPIAAFLALAPAATAHPQDASHTHSFLDGALHPLTGLDHALAMVAVGMFAFTQSDRALWALPLAFVAGMSAGVLWPVDTGLAPAIEIAIASSVIVLGALLAFDARMPRWMTMALVAIAGLAHGAAHSIEGASAQLSAFAAGALTMTALLHVVGAGIGAGLGRTNYTAPRLLGAGIAAAGAFLAIAG